MQPYLVFGLSATLGAMGELAGHERRGSQSWPARSALLGLMAAALGIRRDGDFSALEILSVAVAEFDAGRPFRDYHTIETVPSAAVKKPNSRPEALRMAKGKTNTTITLRDYRADAFFGVAVWGGDIVPIAQALAQPQFTLYFGRKSCPLSAPLGARVVQAETVEAAIAKITLPPWRKGAVARVLIEESEIGEEVHDVAVDRALWHYTSRKVLRRALSIAPQTGDAA
jgi:CRISPR system Cascade subunit CasD